MINLLAFVDHNGVTRVNSKCGCSPQFWFISALCQMACFRLMWISLFTGHPAACCFLSYSVFFLSWYIFCPCLPTFKTFSRALPSVPFLLYSNSHGELTAGCCPFVGLFRSPCVNITGLTGPVCHNLLVRNERIADADSFVDYLNTLRPNSRDPAARCWQRGSSSFHRKNNR